MSSELNSSSTTFTETREFRIKKFSKVLRWDALKPTATVARRVIEFNDPPFWVPARDERLTNSTSTGLETPWRLGVVYTHGTLGELVQINLAAIPTTAEQFRGGWLEYLIDVLTFSYTHEAGGIPDPQLAISFDGFKKV